MVGFPPITDSDGGMGFSSADILAEIFLECCLVFIVLGFILMLYFRAEMINVPDQSSFFPCRQD